MSHSVTPCRVRERSRIHPCNFTKHPCILKNLLDGVQTFFLVECDGKKNGFHWVVVTLIRGRLRVATHPNKESVKMRLILAAQRTSKLFPSLCCLLNELNKCRDGSAHIAPPVNQFTEIRVGRFSRRKRRVRCRLVP